MLTRAWFALSVIWALLMLIAMANPNANEGGREWLVAFAIAPLAAGIGLKYFFRYVSTGSLTRRSVR